MSMPSEITRPEAGKADTVPGEAEPDPHRADAVAQRRQNLM
jgi:hypothetical protein